MADVVILEEQMFTDFTFVSNIGMYTTSQFGLFSLEAGVNYRVLWDNDEYYCTACAAPMNGYDCVILGNEKLVKGESSEITEPFIIYQVLANDYCAIGSMTDTQVTPHTVGIYMVESSSGDTGTTDSNAIIVHDRMGTAIPYSGVGRIRVETANGETRDYISCEITEIIVDEDSSRYDLDFSSGDIIIEADTGTLFEKVTIRKPVNLIPENIAEDAEIAGIVGNFAGGGGVDLGDDLSKYFVYRLDDEKKEIIIYGILWTQLYADTGSYDVTIPDALGSYQVVIASEGVC